MTAAEWVEAAPVLSTLIGFVSGSLVWGVLARVAQQ